MIVVHGFNTIEQRRTLWSELRNLATQCNKPCLVWGDFSTLLQSQNRLYGAPVTRAETRDFAECVQDLLLNEVMWKGEFCSWSNKQLGSARIFSTGQDNGE